MLLDGLTHKTRLRLKPRGELSALTARDAARLFAPRKRRAAFLRRHDASVRGLCKCICSQALVLQRGTARLLRLQLWHIVRFDSRQRLRRLALLQELGLKRHSGYQRNRLVQRLTAFRAFALPEERAVLAVEWRGLCCLMTTGNTTAPCPNDGTVKRTVPVCRR